MSITMSGSNFAQMENVERVLFLANEVKTARVSADKRYLGVNAKSEAVFLKGREIFKHPVLILRAGGLLKYSPFHPCRITRPMRLDRVINHTSREADARLRKTLNNDAMMDRQDDGVDSENWGSENWDSIIGSGYATLPRASGSKLNEIEPDSEGFASQRPIAPEYQNVPVRSQEKGGRSDFSMGDVRSLSPTPNSKKDERAIRTQPVARGGISETHIKSLVGHEPQFDSEGKAPEYGLRGDELYSKVNLGRKKKTSETVAS